MKSYENKKLLILGGNAETVPLVETANKMGITTVVSSSNPESMAKACAAVKYDLDATDIGAMVAVAREENVTGVLPGMDDIFVPAYCKVCDALSLPCYANSEIIEVFAMRNGHQTVVNLPDDADFEMVVTAPKKCDVIIYDILVSARKLQPEAHRSCSQRPVRKNTDCVS